MQNSPNFIQPKKSLSSKTAFVVMLVVAVVLVLLVWVIFGGDKLNIKNSTIQATSQYQAVFLNNGQVYFGKLKQSDSWLELTDVYYLQVTEQPKTNSDDPTQPTTTGNPMNPSQEVKLVKLGSELHGPQDAMYLDRDKILFCEYLKDDSKVLDAIKRYTK